MEQVKDETLLIARTSKMPISTGEQDDLALPKVLRMVDISPADVVAQV